MPEIEFLKEAKQTYSSNSVYAYNLLKKVTSDEYKKERLKILTKIFIDQREYEKAANLLDSIGWSIELSPYEKSIILLNTKRWNQLIELTDDDLLKGIAFYNLGEYQKAIEYLSKLYSPVDYRILYLARSYKELGEYDSLFKTILAIDSVSPYLSDEYQSLLFDLFLNMKDLSLVQTELERLNSPAIREYLLLKIYEKNGDKKNLQESVWRLIKDYPKSQGAFYSLLLAKPTSKLEYKLLGKVYYYKNDYDNAVRYLKKTSMDNEVNYLLGKIYYEQEQYFNALRFFTLSNWAESYYYRGRIYEINGDYNKAIKVYDSLCNLYKNSSYANLSLKRKAFLLEDIGDTLKAIETLLRVGEKNTKFRAALQSFRIGKLSDAAEILKDSDSPEYIYWLIRVKERLGEPVESLKNYLVAQHPFSYYTLFKFDNNILFDTIQSEIWLRQFCGDSSVSFDCEDSLHLHNGVRYLSLNELDYAIKELEMIDDLSCQDLYYLCKLCAQYGADRASILFGLQIKRQMEKLNVRRFPKEIYKLLYPLRYIPTIMEQDGELSLYLAMIWLESLFDPRATSPANAQGLMQIIPQTGSKIAQELGMPSYTLYDYTISIKFGTHYFKNLLTDFNSIPLSLAAYNGGSINVKKWINKNPNAELDEFIELIPFNETRNYIKSVLALQFIYKNLLSSSLSP